MVHDGIQNEAQRGFEWPAPACIPQNLLAYLHSVGCLVNSIPFCPKHPAKPTTESDLNAFVEHPEVCPLCADALSVVVCDYCWNPYKAHRDGSFAGPKFTVIAFCSGFFLIQ